MIGVPGGSALGGVSSRVQSVRRNWRRHCKSCGTVPATAVESTVGASPKRSASWASSDRPCRAGCPGDRRRHSPRGIRPLGERGAGLGRQPACAAQLLVGRADRGEQGPIGLGPVPRLGGGEVALHHGVRGRAHRPPEHLDAEAHLAHGCLRRLAGVDEVAEGDTEQGRERRGRERLPVALEVVQRVGEEVDQIGARADGGVAVRAVARAGAFGLGGLPALAASPASFAYARLDAARRPPRGPGGAPARACAGPGRSTARPPRRGPGRPGARPARSPAHRCSRARSGPHWRERPPRGSPDWRGLRGGAARRPAHRPRHRAPSGSRPGAGARPGCGWTPPASYPDRPPA